MGAMVYCFAILVFVTGDLIVNVSVIFAICHVLGNCSIAHVVLA